MRRGTRGPDKFYPRGIKLYPENELFKELAFIAYYFHWDSGSVLALEHTARRRWCAEISGIHKELNPSPKSKNIFEQ